LFENLATPEGENICVHGKNIAWHMNDREIYSLTKNASLSLHSLSVIYLPLD
jgi:hypothetical protein